MGASLNSGSGRFISNWVVRVSMPSNDEEVKELSEIKVREEMERTGENAATVVERLTGERPRVLRQQREAAASRVMELLRD